MACEAPLMEAHWPSITLSDAALSGEVCMLGPHLGAVQRDCLGNHGSPTLIKCLLHDCIVCSRRTCSTFTHFKAATSPQRSPQVCLLQALCLKRDPELYVGWCIPVTQPLKTESTAPEPITKGLGRVRPEKCFTVRSGPSAALPSTCAATGWLYTRHASLRTLECVLYGVICC